ncbi:CrcB family protein [Herbiconiux sp. KACC 21604]|uniref:fluoride efflux transporter FluC n=1 Tax=unclassified Herbiconiux TaxID=2618217 RepID=UPI00149300C9|nr:CrcB family protein [Herbiconiux sp. SALV-R1]QJU55400.1 CrcB family protein [Herbiconiux sp. SALV-R1]WPO86575.1 CrcB family protein [Herbiconiux sp. KACC 21604]
MDERADDFRAPLPIDSDAADAGSALPAKAEPHAPRPAYLHPGCLALVLIGGALGTALRETVALVVQPIGSFPLAIFGINIVGAFVLGVVLAALALRGPDEGLRRHLRLFVGTGVLGGFTTYSALSADSASLLSQGGLGVALVYGLATVVVGGLASWGGILLGSVLGRAPDARRGESSR